MLEELRRIDKRGALEKNSQSAAGCGEGFRYAFITDRAEYNPAPNLAVALTVPKKNNHPYLPEEKLHHFVRDLETYTGSIITKNTTKIVMLAVVRTQEMRFDKWDEVDLERGIKEIQAKRMKMRRPHIVPVCTQVIDRFKETNQLQATILISLLAEIIASN